LFRFLFSIRRAPPAVSLAAGLLLMGLGIAATPVAVAAAESAPGPEDVRADVWAIVEAKCLRCHNARQKQGRLDMSTRAAMLAGGVSGPAFVVDKAEKSLMIDLIDFDEMPPRKQKPRVTKAEFELLRAWVNSGAPGRQTKEEPAKAKSNESE
jgi:hypothetical protein